MKKIALVLAVALATVGGWADRPKQNQLYKFQLGNSAQPSVSIRYIGMDDCVPWIEVWKLIPERDGKEEWTLSEFVDDAKKSRGYAGETGSTLREYEFGVRKVLRKFKKTISAGDIYFVNIVSVDKSQTTEVVVKIKAVEKGWATDFAVYPLGYLNGEHLM